MTQQLIAAQTRAGALDTVAQADRAIRRLLAAGLTKDQLAVICPAKHAEHFRLSVPQAERTSPAKAFPQNKRTCETARHDVELT